MQEVIDFINGRAYKKEELLEKGKYKVLRVGNFFTNDSWFYSNLELPDDKYCYNGDLLYAWSASFGPQIWNGDKTIFHYHIWNVKYKEEVLFRDYLYYFLLADTATIKKSTTGSTMIHVSMENMKPRFIPIPPITEQHSIVEKIQEILPVVEQYDNAQSKLDSLNKDIKPLLRKSILQEAIQGKLVPQDPNDEPASILLQRIKEEKQRLVKEGKLKKKDVVDSVIFKGDDNRYYEQIGKDVVNITDEIPFDVPDSWVWTRLKHICTKFVDGDHNPPVGTSNKTNFLMLSSRNINNNTLVDLDKVRYLTQDVFNKENERTNAEKGDILFTSVGTLGRSCIFDGSHNICFQRSVSVIRTMIFNRYLKYFLDNPHTQDYIFSHATGTAQKGFYLNQLADVLVSIPPLCEQQRIVNQIEKIFSEIKGN